MQSLGKLTSGQLLTSGLFPALEGEAPPLWADGRNVTFDNEGIRKAYGLLGLQTLSYRPTGLKTTYASNEARAFVGVGDKSYRYRTSVGMTEIASFAQPGVHQFLPWDTWCLISNQVDPVQLWKNAGSASPITAPFTRANCLEVLGLRAIAFGTNNGGNRAEWCSINNIEDWTPSTLNSAGFLNMRTLLGDVVCVKPIGNSLGVYSNMMGGLFTELSGTTSFGFRRPIRGVKAISSNSVVSDGDRHYGLTADNVFVTDLTSFQYVDEPAIRGYLSEVADWDRQAEVNGWVDRSNSQVRWSVPSLGGGVTGVGYRFDKGTWTILDDDILLGDESGAFPYMLQAKETRLLRQDKTSPNNDGVAFGSWVQTKPLDMGNRNRFKRVQKVSIDASWEGDVRFKIGYSNHPNDAPTWVIDKPFANEIFPDEENIQKDGVFAHFRIETTAMNADWRLIGCEIYGEWTGNVT